MELPRHTSPLGIAARSAGPATAAGAERILAAIELVAIRGEGHGGGGLAWQRHAEITFDGGNQGGGAVAIVAAIDPGQLALDTLGGDLLYQRGGARGRHTLGDEAIHEAGGSHGLRRQRRPAGACLGSAPSTTALLR